MNRKTILSVAAVVFMSTLLGILLTATMPLWVPTLMVNPNLITPLSQRLQIGVTKFFMKGVMGGGGKHTKPRIVPKPARQSPSGATGSN